MQDYSRNYAHNYVIPCVFFVNWEIIFAVCAKKLKFAVAFGQSGRQAEAKAVLKPKNIGEMAEWSIAAVLKTVEVHASGGSNPSLSAKNADY